LVEWLCINLTMVWLCVQTMMRTKLNFLFAKFSFGMDIKGHSNASCQERQPNGLRDILLMVIE